MLRALASSNTICDSPSGAWVLYIWFHLSILRRRFFSRWNDDLFFVPCGAWVLFLSIRSQCLFPEGSHQMRMRSQLTYCTFAICPSKDVTMNPLWGFCSVYLEFYTYWCVFSSKPWLQISLCVCWCGASIEGICYWYISPRPINIFTWKVRRAECDIRQQELSEFYKQAENYCCKTKSCPSYVL